MRIDLSTWGWSYVAMHWMLFLESLYAEVCFNAYRWIMPFGVTSYTKFDREIRAEYSSPFGKYPTASRYFTSLLPHTKQPYLHVPSSINAQA
jgi:hypothetical protein